MEHCFFGNNISSKLRILNLIGETCLNQNALIKNMFSKFAYNVIHAMIGWNFNILHVLCLIKFPSSTLSETGR